MPIDRRTFLSKSALLSSSVMLMGTDYDHNSNKAPFKIPGDFSLTLLATNWGFSGSWDEFCAKSKETGYHGIEVWLPQQQKERDELFAATEKYNLKYGLLAAGNESDFKKHLDQFQANVASAVSFNPLYVNCHSGRDHYTFDQNKQFIDFTTQASQSSGVSIYHETHRARMLFAAHITKKFLENNPNLRLTLDISHWCNVHESLLEDQQEAVDLAIGRTDHVHARIGHAEGPQITDPRAPEWKNEVNAHFQWWDKIVKSKSETSKSLTMTAEFGPPNYMSTVPYTRQPLANLWGINAYMMGLWKERYV